MTDFGLPRAVREPHSRRRAQRLTLPLEVVVDGRRFAAADWSVGGFAIVDRSGDWRRGDRCSAELRFPTHDSHWGFGTTVEVVHVDPDGRVGFRFVDLLPGQLEHMHALVAACVSGHVVGLDDFLRAAAGAGASHAGTAAPPIEAVRAPLRRLAGYAAVLALGFLLLMFGGLLVQANFLTVRGVHAAVSVPVIHVRAPVAGTLTAADLAPGAVVPAGAPLFDLADEKLLAEIDLAETELRARTAEIEDKRRRHAQAEAFFGDYSKIALAVLARAEAALVQAEEGLRLAERERERMTALQQAGYLAQSRLDQTIQRHVTAMNAVLAAQANLEQARANVAMSRDGRYFTGSRVDGGDLARLAEEVREATAAHALQSLKLAALRERRDALRQTSPCDCVVVAVQARRGEWVAAGTVVHLLRPREAQPQLIAKVPRDSAKLLETGGAAAIRLPDGAAAIHGSVAAVSHLSPTEPRLGLPEEVERDQRLATVTVVLPSEVAAGLAPGTPAQVAFPIAWDRALGLAW